MIDRSDFPCVRCRARRVRCRARRTNCDDTYPHHPLGARRDRELRPGADRQSRPVVAACGPPSLITPQNWEIELNTDGWHSRNGAGASWPVRLCRCRLGRWTAFQLKRPSTKKQRSKWSRSGSNRRPPADPRYYITRSSSSVSLPGNFSLPPSISSSEGCVV